MSETSGSFTHISVNPPDEDDFVITAGIQPQEPEPQEQPEAQPVEQVEAVPAQASEARQVEEPRELPAEKVAKKPRAKRAPKQDDYRETTLEDLEGEPMSLKQKIVIAAAILCLIGAVAYYFLYLR